MRARHSGGGLHVLTWVIRLFGGKLFRYAAVAVAVAAAIYAWDRYTGGLVEQGYERGRAEVMAEVARRDNEQLKRAMAELRAAEQARVATERKARAALEALAAKHRKEMRDAAERTEALVAGARSGAVVLRDPGVEGTGCAADGGDAAPRAGGPASAGAAGGAPGDLSGEAAAFLLELTGEADRVARDYNRLLGHYRTLEEATRGD